jgi:hypothetical protein
MYIIAIIGLFQSMVSCLSPSTSPSNIPSSDKIHIIHAIKEKKWIKHLHHSLFHHFHKSTIITIHTNQTIGSIKSFFEDLIFISRTKTFEPTGENEDPLRKYDELAMFLKLQW